MRRFPLQVLRYVSLQVLPLRGMLCLMTLWTSAAFASPQEKQPEQLPVYDDAPVVSLESYPEYHGSTEQNPYADGAYADSGYSAFYPTAAEESDTLQPFIANYAPEGEYRQPVSIQFVGEQEALVSTKKSGQIYLLQTGAIAEDQERARVVLHVEGASFGKLLRLTDNVVAVCEQKQGLVLILQRTGSESFSEEQTSADWRVVKRLSAPGYPVDLDWDEQRGRLYASATWAQRLYTWENLDGFQKWSERQSVALPMCGGKLKLLPKQELVLAVDAFGRDYALVSTDSLRVVKHDRLYGHNVTDLEVSPDGEMVYFPHQLLNEFARSVTTNITWGGMISNNIRWLRVERMLHEEGAEIFKKGRFYPLGTPGNGAGDPSSMAVNTQGRIAVTLAGTNRVAIQEVDEHYFRQLPVGYRPVDCAYAPDGERLLVVNQFSDHISVIHLEDQSVENWSLGKLREPTLAEQGEQLFFSSRLSHDSWMSCHSCHSEGHTNGQLNDNFSDKTFGTPKRVLSLLGQAETLPYAWAGSVHRLEDQVANSVVSTMAGKPISAKQVEALAAYIRALPSPPPLQPLTKEIEGEELATQDALVHRGGELFRREGCADCHAGQRFTSPAVYDVGLHDEENMTDFNPPSLIGVSQRQNALLHDGRARSLRDVLVKERHQVNTTLTPPDVDALVQYLESL